MCIRLKRGLVPIDSIPHSSNYGHAHASYFPSRPCLVSGSSCASVRPYVRSSLRPCVCASVHPRLCLCAKTGSTLNTRTCTATTPLSFIVCCMLRPCTQWPASSHPRGLKLACSIAPAQRPYTVSTPALANSLAVPVAVDRTFPSISSRASHSRDNQGASLPPFQRHYLIRIDNFRLPAT